MQERKQFLWSKAEKFIVFLKLDFFIKISKYKNLKSMSKKKKEYCFCFANKTQI